MLLHRDGMIELNYDVASDILSVRWPDMTGYSYAEVKYSFGKLVETLMHYDIKKLLVDSRQNVAETTDAEYSTLIQEFSRVLLSTRLVKVARLEAANAIHETRVKNTTNQVKQELQIPIAFRNFPDEATALAWLKES